MHTIEVSIKNLDDSMANEFEKFTAEFIESLESISGLEVILKTEKVKNTRGVTTLLTGIIATGIKMGAFAAIYILAKDLYSRYFNCEVVLKFKDGTTLTLKNLTQKEAEKKIADHLKK